jgi:hypothetical protein
MTEELPLLHAGHGKPAPEGMKWDPKYPSPVFDKGNKKAQGHGGIMNKFRGRIFKCITPEMFDALILKMYKSAMDGNSEVQKYLVDRCAGKVSEKVEVSGDTGNSYNLLIIRKQLPTPEPEPSTTIDVRPVEPAPEQLPPTTEAQ